MRPDGADSGSLLTQRLLRYPLRSPLPNRIASWAQEREDQEGSGGCLRTLGSLTRQGLTFGWKPVWPEVPDNPEHGHLSLHLREECGQEHLRERSMSRCFVQGVSGVRTHLSKGPVALPASAELDLRMVQGP